MTLRQTDKAGYLAAMPFAGVPALIAKLEANIAPGCEKGGVKTARDSTHKWMKVRTQTNTQRSGGGRRILR